MARIVKDHLIGLLRTSDVFAEFQPGAHKNRSRASCHFDCFDLVTLNVDTEKTIIMTFLDVAKEFDCVPNERLLSESNHMAKQIRFTLPTTLVSQYQWNLISNLINHLRCITW